MKFKGIKKGDKDFRHFTFDDNDYIKKDGVYYYRVNYGKNKLEGPDAEDEIGYVACNKEMPIGGKGPSFIPGEEKKADTAPMQYMPPKVNETPQQVQTQLVKQEEPKRRGRPPKIKTLETSNETLTTAPLEEKFEYYVTELTFTNSANLQELLNKLGAEGWELCGFEGSRNMFAATHIVAVFKRKRG